MKQTLSKKLVVALCTLITMLPSLAIAQTAAEEGDNSLPAAVTGSPTNTSGSVTLLINVTSEKNNRFLGDVKITLERYPQTSQYTPDLVQNPITIPEPPTPGGYKVENVKVRQYEIIAERKGYKVYNQVLDLQSQTRYTELNIKMTPLVGTPEVNESDLTSYQNSFGNYLASQYGTNSNQYPYSNNNPYSTTNNGGVYNPYTNYPNYSQTSYTNTGTNTNNGGLPGYNNQYGAGTYGNGQYPYQQTYNTYVNEQFVVPLVVNINQSGGYNANELTVEVYDLGYTSSSYNPNYTTLSNKITLTPQNTTNSSNQGIISTGQFYSTQTLYGCLQPNRNYQVVVRQGYNFSTYQASTAQPTSRNFTSPGATDSVRINVYPPSGYTGIIQISTETVSQNNLYGFPMKCPSSNYSTTATTNNGPTVFGDSQIYFNNLSNYMIQRMPQNGFYYLVNKSNASDFRQLYFVDRGDGQGGLVFFSATQTAYNQEPPSDSQWYFTGYTRSNNDDIRFNPEVFTKSPMTPSIYSRLVKQEISKFFGQSSATATPTATVQTSS